MSDDSFCVICNIIKGDVVPKWDKKRVCRKCDLVCSDGLDASDKQMIMNRGVPEECIEYYTDDEGRGNIIIPSPFKAPI